MKPILSFNKKDIAKLANSQSFERGESYYRSKSVKKITQIGNHFEGKVFGSEVYHVSLDIEDDELDFDCTCPYDFDGICKHCVAFGLAVLNGEYTEMTEVKPIAEAVTPEIFKQHYGEADTQKKLSFLKQLLDKDYDLQSQFVAFVKGKAEKLDAIAGIDIERIAEEIHEELSSIDFDDVVEDYNNYSNGYYDDEGYADEAYELIEKALEPYFKQAVDYVKKGNLMDGLRTMLGIYEGTQNLEEPHDNYGLFYDGYNSKVFEYVGDYFTKFAKETEPVVKSDENIRQVLDVLFERFNKIQNTENEENNTSYDIKHFESLLLSLLTNQEVAEYLYSKLRENDLECLGTAYVILRIADITDNQWLWLQTAETFSELESPIALNLLNKYKQLGQTYNFNRIAEKAFTTWADKFDAYLVENLDKELQKELYIKALTHQTKREHKISLYKQLREFLTDDERNDFIELKEVKNYTEFYIEILEVEKRFGEILQFIQKESNQYHLERNIRPILNVYPNESFAILKTRCEKELNSPKRDRSTYQYMVKLLQVMQLIVSKQIETRSFCQLLFANRLPALKDEMQRAKLV